MPLTSSRVRQACLDVLLCQIGEVVEYLLVRHAGGEIGEHLVDGDAHAANRRLTAALAGFEGDDILISRRHMRLPDRLDDDVQPMCHQPDCTVRYGLALESWHCRDRSEA